MAFEQAPLHRPEPPSEAWIKASHLWIAALFVASVLGGLGLVYLRGEPLIAMAAGIPILVLLLTRPFVGLVALIIIMVANPGEQVSALGALHVERIVAGAVIVGLLLEARHLRRPLIFGGHALLYAMYAFCVALALTGLTSIYLTGTKDMVVGFLRTLTYCLLMINVVRTPGRLAAFMRLFMMLHIYLAVSTLRDYYTGKLFVAQGIQRAIGSTSYGGDPNSLATTLVACIPFFVLGMVVERRNAWKLLWVLGLAASLWTIVLTGSRAGFLGVLLVSTLLWLMSPRKALNFALALGLIVSVWIVMPAQYKTRYLSIGNSQIDESSQGRIDAWKAGIQMFLDRPLLGVGAGNFSPAHAAQAKEGAVRHWLQPHSLYVQALAETGVVGTLAFFTFVFLFYTTAGRQLRRFPVRGRGLDYRAVVVRGGIIAFSGLLLNGVFGHLLYRVTWYLVAALLIISDRVGEAEPARRAAAPAGAALPGPAPLAGPGGAPR